MLFLTPIFFRRPCYFILIILGMSAPSVDESTPTACQNSPWLSGQRSAGHVPKGEQVFQKMGAGLSEKGRRVQGQRGAEYSGKGAQGTRAKGRRVTALPTGSLVASLANFFITKTTTWSQKSSTTRREVLLCTVRQIHSSFILPFSRLVSCGTDYTKTRRATVS